MKGDINDTMRREGPNAVRARHDRAPRYEPRHRPNGFNRAKCPELESVVASSITMRAVEWLWPSRFALGKLAYIGGLPDKGKGLISCSIIACATANAPLPCGEGSMPQGNVVWLTAEDDIEDTIIPRLRAAGADCDRVHIIKMLREKNGKRRMFSLVTDLDALRGKIDEIGSVVLIIIDPLSAYIGTGKVNSHMTADVRGFLAPLVDLAAEKKVAVIGIMHFNKKSDVTNAMLRIADSLAYVAAARHVYFVADDAEVERRRLFVKAKNNLSPRETNSAAAVAAKMAQEGKSGHVGRLRVEVGRKSLTFFSFWPSSKTANMAKMPSGPVGHLPGSPCAGRGPRTVSPSVKRFETIPKKPAWYGGFMNGYSLDTRSGRFVPRPKGMVKRCCAGRARNCVRSAGFVNRSGLMPEAEKRRYLAVIELRKDTPLTELGQRVAALHGLLKRFSNNDTELAFASADARLFGVLFKAPTSVLVIRAELDKMTVNGDKFLVFEAGDFAAEKGLGRPATWLQRR